MTGARCVIFVTPFAVPWAERRAWSTPGEEPARDGGAVKVRLVRRNDEDARLMADLNRLAATDDDGAGPIALPEHATDAAVDGASVSHARPRGRAATFFQALVRKNDDPRLLADLARLAGRTEAEDGAAEDPERARVRPVAADPISAQLAQSEETARLAEDTFVVGFIRTATHVRRYLPYYVVTAAWVLVMLLVSPRTAPTQDADFASSRLGESSEAAGDLDVGGSAAEPADDLSQEFDTDFSTGALFPDLTADSFDSPSEPSGSSTFASTGPTVTTTTPTTAPGPIPLAMVESGYASHTGGTPAEQGPPNGGLPIWVSGGQATKYSYFRLSGTSTVLFLKEATDPGTNVNAERAAMKLCPVTAGEWAPQRGLAMTEAPAYDSACSTGVRAANGTWRFDFGTNVPDRRAGYALVPTVDPTLNYQVTIQPRTFPGAS